MLADGTRAMSNTFIPKIVSFISVSSYHADVRSCVRFTGTFGVKGAIRFKLIVESHDQVMRLINQLFFQGIAFWTFN